MHRDIVTEVPGLPDLINAEAWRDILLPMLRLPEGAAIADVRIVRVYPFRLDGFGVQAEVSIVNDGRRRIKGFIYLTSGMKACRRPSRQLQIRPGSPFIFYGVWYPLNQSPFVIHTADRDDGLPGLSLASTKQHFSPRLCTLAKAVCSDEAKRWQCTLGNYRPRRRCTLIYRSDSTCEAAFVVGKMFRKGQAVRHGANARRLAAALRRDSDDYVVAPRVRAVWPNWNMVVFEGLGGARPQDRQNSLERSRPAANILARLHRVTIQGLPTFGPTDELGATRRWVELADRLGKLRPLGRRLWSSLEGSAPRTSNAKRCVIHRDFYASQILPIGEQWGLIDFDTAAIGEPEQDIANYLGHMIWEGVMDGRRAREYLEVGSDFVSQYSAASAELRGTPGIRPVRINTRLLRFYLLSSLLRVGIIHSLRSGCDQRALHLHRVATGCITELLETGAMDHGIRAAV